MILDRNRNLAFRFPAATRSGVGSLPIPRLGGLMACNFPCKTPVSSSYLRGKRYPTRRGRSRVETLEVALGG
jgi:hypothetical protein